MMQSECWICCQNNRFLWHVMQIFVWTCWPSYSLLFEDFLFHEPPFLKLRESEFTSKTWVEKEWRQDDECICHEILNLQSPDLCITYLLDYLPLFPLNPTKIDLDQVTCNCLNKNKSSYDFWMHQSMEGYFTSDH